MNEIKMLNKWFPFIFWHINEWKTFFSFDTTYIAVGGFYYLENKWGLADGELERKYYNWENFFEKLLLHLIEWVY